MKLIETNAYIYKTETKDQIATAAEAKTFDYNSFVTDGLDRNGAPLVKRPKKRGRSESPVDQLERDFINKSIYVPPHQEVQVRYRRKEINFPNEHHTPKRTNAKTTKLRKDTPYPREKQTYEAGTPTKAGPSRAYPQAYVTVEDFSRPPSAAQVSNK